MADNVNLIVNETIDNVVINPSITTEAIGLTVTGTDTTIEISVTPNLTTVNINEVAGVVSQNLQEVTNVGSTTTNSITAESFVKSGGSPTQFLMSNGSVTIGNGGVYSYEIHVSQVDGNDTTGTGAVLNPVASITKALTLVGPQRKTIIIHPGNYTESPSITSQYTVLTTYQATGGNTLITGTVSTNTGCSISGLKMTNLTINGVSGRGNINILNCDISGNFTKSGTADYTLIRFCDIGTLNIVSSAGALAVLGGNLNFITINSVGAAILVKNAVCVSPVVLIGSATFTDCILISTGTTTNALTSSAGTNIVLANSQCVIPTFQNVARVSLSGFYSILNCVYDKPNSILVAGGSTNSIGYSQYINADKFIKQGGTGLNVLLDDGTTKSLSSIITPTNLTPSQTASSFNINSDTGSDATIPLGNGTLAGASLNNYTTAEQTKLAGIATGAEVNVNADWNAVSGDAEILNKPTIPSISGLATITYVDTQDALKVDKVAGSRLITSSESTILGNTSGVNTGDQDLTNLVVKNTAIVGATKTKITYDSKGLVTVGEDATTVDIADTTNKRYVTDANLVTIANQSGTNTGDNATNSQYIGLAASKQDNIILTTTGTSGASTLDGATLNIPQYSGATNLTTSQTSTNFTINSSTGDDASVPLGNGTLAGATLNDYTSAEKSLVATIPNINTNAINRDTVKLAEAINKGQAVYVSGASGTNILVSKASNVSEATSSKTFGLLETTGVLNDIVNIVTSGLLSGLNTNTATIGDAVWLGTSENLIFGLTNKPVAPANLVFIGIVTRVSATVGEIYISIQNGFELTEIHDVLLTSLANNQGLFYDSATSLWKNKTVETALGFTPYNATNPSGYQTAGQVQTIADAKVVQTITNGVTTTAPSQDAVFDALELKQPLATVLTNTTASYTTAEQTKLSAIATGATANSSDATLLARANHTGTQIASTISDIQSTITNNTSVLANTAKISFDSTSSTRLANTSGTNTGDQDLSSLAPKASPTFTGTVTIPSGASISGFAPLESPFLTGTPTSATTPTASNNSTTLANTAYVDRQVGLGGPAYNILIAQTADITTELTGTSGGVSYPQNGRNVMINNSVFAININATVASTATDFIASYTKIGTAAITFTFTGTAATLIAPNGAILNGTVGSTALLTKNGTTVYLLINNLS